MNIQLLLRAIGGPPGLTAFARSIGDERTRLDRWETELNSAIPGDPRDTSTPAALAGGFTAILVGDFNRVPWSFAMRRIDERVTLRRRTHGLATWPHRLPTADGGLPLPLPVLPIDQPQQGAGAP